MFGACRTSASQVATHQRSRHAQQLASNKSKKHAILPTLPCTRINPTHMNLQYQCGALQHAKLARKICQSTQQRHNRARATSLCRRNHTPQPASVDSLPVVIKPASMSACHGTGNTACRATDVQLADRPPRIAACQYECSAAGVNFLLLWAFHPVTALRSAPAVHSG